MLVTQDPKRSFTTTLADGRVGWKAVIRSAAGLTPVHTKRHGVPAALQRAPRRSDRNQPADFDDVVARKSEEIADVHSVTLHRSRVGTGMPQCAAHLSRYRPNSAFDNLVVEPMLSTSFGMTSGQYF